VIVTLRPFTEADIEFAAELLQIPEVERWWNTHDADKVREEMLDDPDATYLVIDRDGEAVGIMGWYEEDDPDYRHAGMDIAVHPSVFGAGVAVEALRQACRFLIEERGHHRVIIDPNAANERAIACYRKVGFKPVGVMRRYERNLHGEWTDGLLMDLLADELT
jgi:aminoglycoside 6'-N-acetyltransferase